MLTEIIPQNTSPCNSSNTPMTVTSICNLQAIEKTFSEIGLKPVWAINNPSEKTPVNPKTEKFAKIDDPSTWVTFEEVKEYLSIHPGCLPVLAIHKELGIVIIDLDNVRKPITGDILPQAQEIIDKLHSAAEISRSGTGVHIYVQGEKPGSSCKCSFREGALEIYDKHFITLTGNFLPSLNIVESRQAELEEIYNQYFPEPSTPITQIEKKSPPMADTGVIHHCQTAKNSDKFESLYDLGDLTGHNNDASAADLALLGIIAFYTQDKGQIERIMNNSALGKREKWTGREDYRKRTIDKALENITGVYHEQSAFYKKSTNTTSRDIWETPLPVETDDGDELPTQFPINLLPEVLQNAVCEIGRAFQVDPALPAAPGLANVSLQIGKKAKVVEKTGLLHYPALFFIVVAESGERKSSSFNVILRGTKERVTAEEAALKEVIKCMEIDNELIEGRILLLKKSKASQEEIRQQIINLRDQKKEIPVGPRNWCEGDITSERIVQKLGRHKGVYGIFTAEGRLILNRILGKGSREGSTDEEILIAATWGDDLHRSRVGSNTGVIGGEDTVIPNPALTICIATQPDIWNKVSKNPTMRESGFLSRVCVTLVNSRIGSRIEREADKEFQPELIYPYDEAIQKIRQWNPKEAVIVALDPEATIYRREFFNAIEKDLGSGGRYEDVKDIATKATSLATRLALNIAVLEAASTQATIRNPFPNITGEQWLRAQGIQEYYLAQAIISQRMRNSKESTHILETIGKHLATEAKKHVETKGIHEPLFLLASQIAKCVGHCDKERILEVMPKCIEKGWLRKGPDGRRGSQRFEVNSKIRQIFISRDKL